MAYSLALFLHSLLRWVTVAFAVVVCVRSYGGMRENRAVTKADNRLAIFFVTSVDLQWLVGVVLYVFLSPITMLFFASPGTEMKNAVVRFYGVEHITLMMLAFIVAHVARVRSKRREGAASHRQLFIGTIIFLVLVVGGMPWPGRAAGRPLLRSPISSAEATLSCSFGSA
jgi:hypothetical protein